MIFRFLWWGCCQNILKGETDRGADRRALKWLLEASLSLSSHRGTLRSGLCVWMNPQRDMNRLQRKTWWHLASSAESHTTQAPVARGWYTSSVCCCYCCSDVTGGKDWWSVRWPTAVSWWGKEIRYGSGWILGDKRGHTWAVISNGIWVMQYSFHFWFLIWFHRSLREFKDDIISFFNGKVQFFQTTSELKDFKLMQSSELTQHYKVRWNKELNCLFVVVCSTKTCVSYKWNELEIPLNSLSTFQTVKVSSLCWTSFQSSCVNLCKCRAVTTRALWPLAVSLRSCWFTLSWPLETELAACLGAF